MAYTTEQLAALEAALATGATRVETNGNVVQYRSLAEMRSLAAEMRSELGIEVTSTSRGRAWTPITGDGL